MLRRYLEDRRMRKRVKTFLARDPDYLTFDQQAELGLVPIWELEWDADFLWWGVSDHLPEYRVMHIERPEIIEEPAKRRQSRTPCQKTHPALDALQNTKGKSIDLVVHPIAVELP